jgi:AcrR family transcriptional regulator
MAMALSRDDWTRAALDALATDGLAGVAVEPLARRLGASKGSFYWHFRDRDELIAASLERWERRDTVEVIAALETIPDPRDRLRELARSAYAGAAEGRDAQPGVLAAASDPRVAPVLKRVTRTRLAFMERLFQALGLDPPVARARAQMAYALYVGLGDLRRAFPQPPLSGPELAAQVELIVDALAAPPRATARPDPSVARRGALADPPDRLLDAAGPRVAMPGEHERR